MSRPIRIAHVVHRFDCGGLQNGMVNIINGLPRQDFDHTIISLTGSTEFRRRLPDNVPILEIHKPPGNSPAYLYRIARMLRAGGYDILHTRNLPTLESQAAGWWAGVPRRVHGEHGWDVFDLDGRRRGYRLLRRAFRPLVHRYVVVSRHLGAYLEATIGVAPERIARICNGVDTVRFRPRDVPSPRAGTLVVGSVGRLEAVKDYPTLVDAVAQLHREPGTDVRLRLVGEGTQRPAIEDAIERLGLRDSVSLPGGREDVPEQLREMDVFVLPSRAEGISNTILEAMATGLPVVATRVGGNDELVVHGETGFLVPAGDAAAMAGAVARYRRDPELLARHGRAARARAEHDFSLPAMVAAYGRLYGELMAGAAETEAA